MPFNVDVMSSLLEVSNYLKIESDRVVMRTSLMADLLSFWLAHFTWVLV